MKSNRESGSWLPDVEHCPNRAVPCGNPLDADEAMRAGQIEAASDGGVLSRLSFTQALGHAKKIAKNCSVPPGECPLERCFGCNRLSALDQLCDSARRR